MTPEEKSRIEAETKKLRAETQFLKKSGWGKPVTWLPILVAVTAIASSIGQFQYSSLKEREEALGAREKVFDAKKEEKILLERNLELEARSEQLSIDVQKSTSEIQQLQAQITNANEQIILVSESKNQGTSLSASIKIDVEARAALAATIVESAEKRNSKIAKFKY